MLHHFHLLWPYIRQCIAALLISSYVIESKNYDVQQPNHATLYSSSGDSLTYHVGAQFSTFDRENGAHKNCAVLYKGAWWYVACHKSNLNGHYYHGSHPSYADGVEWYHWTGYHYSMRNTEMKIRPADVWFYQHNGNAAKKRASAMAAIRHSPWRF